MNSESEIDAFNGWFYSSGFQALDGTSHEYPIQAMTRTSVGIHQNLRLWYVWLGFIFFVRIHF